MKEKEIAEYLLKKIKDKNLGNEETARLIRNLTELLDIKNIPILGEVEDEKITFYEKG